MEQEQDSCTGSHRGSRKIAEIYHAQDFTVTEKANDKGPLTEADLAANAILCAHIARAFPNDAILSEETTDNPDRLSNARCWIVTPWTGRGSLPSGFEFMRSPSALLSMAFQRSVWCTIQSLKSV